MSRSAEHRLVTYGTLAPGRVNHHQLADLRGSWLTGTVRGRLVDEGWGAAHGCPGIILDEGAETVDVFVFESEDLPAHWPRLDTFEGEGYRRSVVKVETEDGVIEGSIYALAV